MMSNFTYRISGAFAFAAAIFVASLTPPALAGGGCHAPFDPHTVIDQHLIDACTAIVDGAAETAVDRSEALGIRGFAQLHLHNLNGAIADFSARIAIDPSNPKAAFDRAMAYADKNDLDRALPDYDRAIALDPKFALAYFGRGGARQTKGDLTRAQADFDEAIRLNPDNSGYYRARGLLRKRREDYDGAVTDLSNAIRLNPNDKLAYIFRGNTYKQQTAFDKALADYESALRIGHDELAYAWRADVRNARGDYEYAIADYGRALDITPDDVSIHVHRSVAFAGKGDYEHALADQDAALKLEPEDARLRNMRAHLRFTAGHFAEAAVDFADVVERSPEYIFGKLLRYLARARSGDSDTAELRRNAADLDRSRWPWPIFAIYLGDMTREQMLDAVKTMNVENNFRDCDVAFYLGEYLLTHRHRDEALPFLKQAAETCSGDGEFERDAARGEVGRWQEAK
jgi:tetratricopeptide (TPR) repeat protein